jgi:hypothetical protein
MDSLHNSCSGICIHLGSIRDPAIWAVVEAGLGFTTAGASMLRPLLKGLFGGSSTADNHVVNNPHTCLPYDKLGIQLTID